MAASRDEWALELSRYMHLNPVRIQALGLSKKDRAAQPTGWSAASSAEAVR